MCMNQNRPMSIEIYADQTVFTPAIKDLVIPFNFAQRFKLMMPDAIIFRHMKYVYRRVLWRLIGKTRGAGAICGWQMGSPSSVICKYMFGEIYS